MPPKFVLPPIYPITDPRSGLSHREQVARLIAGGAKIIQFRDKEASPRDFYEAAQETIELTRRHGVPLIVNDRVDIALAIKAAGVHLGQDDLPPYKAREILGESAIIGFSTHSVEQAAGAAAWPVDYIAIGPIFVTQTKADPEPTVGLDGLAAVRNTARNKPIVAIGGINAQNIRAVLDAGADSAAMIASIVSDAASIETRMREFVARAINAAKHS
jgi:thiamine-phosphate pyrophosphorylase